MYDVTILDKVIPLKKAEAWNNYPDCSNTTILKEDKYKFAKLRPILFFKDHKGKTTKIMGYHKEKLVSLLEKELSKK